MINLRQQWHRLKTTSRSRDQAIEMIKIFATDLRKERTKEAWWLNWESKWGCNLVAVSRSIPVSPIFNQIGTSFRSKQTSLRSEYRNFLFFPAHWGLLGWKESESAYGCCSGTMERQKKWTFEAKGQTFHCYSRMQKPTWTVDLDFHVNKQRHVHKWCFRIEYHLQNCLFSVKSTDIPLLSTLNKEIVCNEWIWFCYGVFLAIMSTRPPVRPPCWIPGVAMAISLIDRSTSRALVCEKSSSSTRSSPSPRRTLKFSQKQGRPMVARCLQATFFLQGRNVLVPVLLIFL